MLAVALHLGGPIMMVPFRLHRHALCLQLQVAAAHSYRIPSYRHRRLRGVQGVLIAGLVAMIMTAVLPRSRADLRLSDLESLPSMRNGYSCATPSWPSQRKVGWDAGRRPRRTSCTTTGRTSYHDDGAPQAVMGQKFCLSEQEEPSTEQLSINRMHSCKA